MDISNNIENHWSNLEIGDFMSHRFSFQFPSHWHFVRKLLEKKIKETNFPFRLKRASNHAGKNILLENPDDILLPIVRFIILLLKCGTFLALQ